MEADSVTSTSVTLQWLPPKYPNGVIIQYSIEYDGNITDEFGDNLSDKKMNGTITGLSPDTIYVLKMKAFTSVGPGPPVSLTVRTCKLLKIMIQSFGLDYKM